MLYVWKVELYSQKLLAKKEKKEENSRIAARVGKRQWRIVSF